MKPEPDKLRAARKKKVGEDTVVISNENVVERYSSLYKALLELEPENPEIEAEEVVTSDQAEFFRQILGRGLDEDRYIIRRQIARGGMGILFSVYDRDFQRHSVMKVLRPDVKKDVALIKAFVREARITAQLEHPNIVPVHDLGMINGEGPFFTMKHVQGESLNKIIHHLEQEDIEYLEKYDMFALLEIFRKVCDAVAFAHAKKILHRDIKPHNIMVGDFGEVYLMDWGLAKHLEKRNSKGFDPDATHISPGTVVLKGSPGYMSPEQAGYGDVELDERSDIFLLGATLYHMFTFFPPYIGTSISSILKCARECDYLRPDELALSSLQIPDDLARIINKAMSKHKDDRYQSVEEMVADIDDLLYGRMETECIELEPGQLLLKEGEEGDKCFIIESGKLEIVKGEGDNTVVLNVLGPGDILGEMALITHEKRSASARAIEKSEVLVLDDKLFQRNLSRLPPWMNNAIMTLAKRLTKADRELTKLRQENGTDK